MYDYIADSTDGAAPEVLQTLDEGIADDAGCEKGRDA